MRPVEKRGLPADPFGPPLVAYLLQKLGPYCSFCERPLPDECWLWDKSSGFQLSSALIPITQTAVNWSDLFILDRNCALAHEQRRAYYRQALGGLLLMPDDDEPSFRVRGPSPITYSLKKFQSIVIDEEGKEITRTDVDAVLATGFTDEAIRTIEHFGLNTRYYDQATGVFRIPEDEYDSAYDRRVSQRTEAWRMAERLAGIIANTEESEFQNRLIDEARLTIAAAGFWSTWATVLSEQISSTGTLLRLLRAPDELEWTAGPGPHNTFPGTRTDWIQ